MLWRPDLEATETYPLLQPVLSTRAIQWDLIEQQYDEMVKYATALRLGTAATRFLAETDASGLVAVSGQTIRLVPLSEAAAGIRVTVLSYRVDPVCGLWIENDAIEGVGACAPDAHHFNRDVILFPFREAVVMTELDHIRWRKVSAWVS
jgi:hypothetical protein